MIHEGEEREGECDSLLRQLSNITVVNISFLKRPVNSGLPVSELTRLLRHLWQYVDWSSQSVPAIADNLAPCC